MHMLYDSDSFVVVHISPEAPAVEGQDDNSPKLQRHGFEIVDKRTGKELYLDGSWAELFQRHIQEWQANTPTQEEVEETLGRYAELAQNPVLMH